MKQVNADRATFGPMIQDLAPQIEAFRPQETKQVEAFVAEVDRRLGRLSDERMVLKGFASWPEKKLEMLREVAARTAELHKLRASIDSESDSWSGKNSIGEELQQVIDKFDAYQPAVEWYLRSADDLRRQYSQYQIPFEFSLLKDLTVASVALAKYAMTMVLTAYDRLKELQEQGDPRAPKAQVEGLLQQGLKFSFRCHQFAGGFDDEANGLFARVHDALSDVIALNHQLDE